MRLEKLSARSAFLLSGESPGAGEPTRILYAGNRGAFLHYLKLIGFRGHCNVRELGSVRLWDIKRVCADHACDIRFVLGSGSLFQRALFKSDFFLPQWVSADVDLSHESVYRGSSPSRRRDIRRVDSGGLSYVVTTDPEDLRHFYAEMYVPTMDSAHGKAAIKMADEEMVKRARSGEAELVYIKDGNDPVGGSLVVYDAGAPRLLSMGVLHGDRAYFRRGVGDAIYILSFRHLFERGYTWVDVGRSRPFLADGTLYYKRRLGIRLTSGSKNGFFVTFLNRGAAVRDFLCHNPFIYRHGPALKGLAFYGSEHDKEAAVALHVPGLAEFNVVDVTTDFPTGPDQV
jgi:hypothetical protein